ncbi:unnamed protein product, partial [Staurois parvus]
VATCCPRAPAQWYFATCCPRPLPRGRLPPVAQDPCPGVDCRLLPEVPAQW